jgi:hypothetical protein
VEGVATRGHAIGRTTCAPFARHIAMAPASGKKKGAHQLMHALRLVGKFGHAEPQASPQQMTKLRPFYKSGGSRQRSVIRPSAFSSATVRRISGRGWQATVAVTIVRTWQALPGPEDVMASNAMLFFKRIR